MTEQVDSAVRMLFNTMVSVMQHAGMSHAQIFEALKGLVNNWWIDTSMYVIHSIMEVL